MSVLQDFRTAVANGNESRAVELGPQVTDVLGDRTDREISIETAARFVLNEADVSGSTKELARQLVEQIVEAGKHRSELSLVLLGLAAGRFDRDTALDVIDGVIEIQSTIDETAAEFRETDAAKNLKPILLLIAPDKLEIPKGKTRTATITVENTGGTPAERVTIDLESELNNVAITPAQIDLIDAGESITVELEAVGTDGSGQFSLRMIAEATNSAIDAVPIQVIIVTKNNYVEEAVNKLNDLQEHIEALSEELRRPIRPFNNIINRIQRELEELSTQLEAGEISEQEADQRINDIQQQLNGLRGLLSSLQQIEEGQRASLQNDVDVIEETLETAQEAAI